MEEPRFIADAMLGKLAKWLRMLGYDTLYFRDATDDTLAFCAHREKRWLLTRKTHLKKRNDLREHLFFISSNAPLKQLLEVTDVLRPDSTPPPPFTRCLICNHTLSEIPSDQIRSIVPDYVITTQQHFSTCPSCKRIFWRGTHYETMHKTLAELHLVPQPDHREPRE